MFVVGGMLPPQALEWNKNSRLQRRTLRNGNISMYDRQPTLKMVQIQKEDISKLSFFRMLSFYEVPMVVLHIYNIILGIR